MGKRSVCSTAAKNAINEVLILCQPKRGPKHMFHKRCDSHRDHTATKGFRINEFILYQKECFQIIKETTLLVDDDNYFICQSMKKKIDDTLKKRDREAAAAAAANNNNNTNTNADPPGGELRPGTITRTWRPQVVVVSRVLI